MALTFGAATSDNVSHGSASALDTQATWTFAMWVNITTLTANRRLMAKGSGKYARIGATTSQLVVFVNRNGGGATYASATGTLTTGAWIFLAFTYNASGGAGEVINIYKGTLTTAAAETTYASTADGSGNTSSDAASSLTIGGDGGTQALQGAIANTIHFNRVLTADEIGTLQFWMRPTANCLLYTEYGYAGTGTQPDWSGSGNTGTVSGATVSDHVPVIPVFARRMGFQSSVIVAAASTYRGWYGNTGGWY